MLPVILSVVVISLSGVMMPGPVFAVTLAKSFKSPLAGAQIALGHAVIELPVILLVYFGFAQIFENNLVQIILSIAGGGMIIWLGAAMFRNRSRVVRQGQDSTYSAFTAGVITSGLNPFFLLWWATVGSLLMVRFLEYGVGGLVVFTISHWVADFLWLSLVSVVVYKTHRLWGEKLQEWVFIATSAALAGFGLWYVISGFQIVF